MIEDRVGGISQWEERIEEHEAENRTLESELETLVVALKEEMPGPKI